MERQILMDKLSEFLMVEQGGLELYRVALSRCTNPDVRQRFLEFAQETSDNRAILMRLIEELGGDPSYVSPTARLAQLKACSLLETAIRADGLSQEELEANDLENMLLAETKDHAGWQLLQQVAQQVDDRQVGQAIEEAVRQVEPKEDRRLEWARMALAQTAMQMIMQGPAPDPQRWQGVISTPETPISQVHPRPLPEEDEGLLETARQAAWMEPVVLRDANSG